MGELILVTGGARSGKSLFAEQLAGDGKSEVTYIATSVAIDKEMEFRIGKHRERRPASWETIEAPFGLSKCDEIHRSVILIDCITIMITNIMLREMEIWDNASPSDIQRVESAVLREIDYIIDFSKRTGDRTIVVSNEVGMGLVPAYELGRAFRDCAGRANQKIAKSSDEVYFCVSGIPVKIK